MSSVNSDLLQYASENAITQNNHNWCVTTKVSLINGFSRITIAVLSITIMEIIELAISEDVQNNNYTHM